MSRGSPRDHGGGLDAVLATFGGARSAWLDLSTGINPTPYKLPLLSPEAWSALPDHAAQTRLINAASSFWQVPEQGKILAANGASALIAMMPRLVAGQTVSIPGPTYNEHAAAFAANGWTVLPHLAPADALVLVNPNNPDGRVWTARDFDPDAYRLIVLDESFCDVLPQASMVALAGRPNVVILKSFGKFWGLAGMRLGFAIASEQFHATLTDALGPWPVSGPALEIGAVALADPDWATTTRATLSTAAARLDTLAVSAGFTALGGTDLFRLYDTPDAAKTQGRLTQHQILGRIFPYSRTWLRLGLPATGTDWQRLATALGVRQ